MKKNILFLIALACLSAACAGNPPAWWNPSNTYSSGENSKPAARTESSGSVSMNAQPQEPAPIPQEETIAPLPDESYEEMILTPLQDEETENASGESSSQSSPAETGMLPPPSVLESL